MNYKKPILIVLLFTVLLPGMVRFSMAQQKVKFVDIHFHSYDLHTIKDSVNAYFEKNQAFDIPKLGVITIAGRKDTALVSANNDLLLNYAASDQRVLPICSVNPYDLAFSIHELERLKARNVKLIKMHPVSQGFNVADSAVYKITKKAGELGICILFDGYNPVDAGQIGKFITLAWRCPGTKIIIAHTGMYDFIKLNEIKSLKEYPEYKQNIYVDIAEVAPVLLNSPYRDQLIWTLKNIGLDHVLFGSGTPSFTAAVTVDALQKANFSKKELEQIFYSNAASLLGLDR